MIPSAIRKGISYLKAPQSFSSKNTTQKILNNNSNNNSNLNLSSNSNKISNNSNNDKNKTNNSKIYAGNIKNNNNSAVFSSYQEGYQFNANELWLRMSTRGGRKIQKNPSIGSYEQNRNSHFSHFSQNNNSALSDPRTAAATGLLKNINRKNSYSGSNDNLSTFTTYGHGATANFLKKNPQSLILRQDVVTYSDGSNYMGEITTSLQPPTTSIVPTTSVSLDTSNTSFTTAFSTSTFATSLLSKQLMGTIVLPDLVIITNEIPWCTVARDFSVLTAEDICFDLFGK